MCGTLLIGKQSGAQRGRDAACLGKKGQQCRVRAAPSADRSQDGGVLRVTPFRQTDQQKAAFRGYCPLHAAHLPVLREKMDKTSFAFLDLGRLFIFHSSFPTVLVLKKYTSVSMT